MQNILQTMMDIYWRFRENKLARSAFIFASTSLFIGSALFVGSCLNNLVTEQIRWSLYGKGYETTGFILGFLLIVVFGWMAKGISDDIIRMLRKSRKGSVD